MQTPNVNTPVARLIGSVHYLIAALLLRPSTADLAPSIQATFDAFLASVAATTTATHAAIPTRVAVRFAERELEQVIRHLFLAAQVLDGGKPGGRAATGLFPTGLTPVVAPQGEEQSAVAKQLLDRLIAQADAASLRAVHEPALRGALDAMTTHLAARDAAIAAQEAAVVAQTAAREQLTREYDRVANTVRARFPKDRAQQDLFFDVLRVSRKDEASDDGEPAPMPLVVNGGDHA